MRTNAEPVLNLQSRHSADEEADAIHARALVSGRDTVRQKLFDHIPPAMIAVVVLFWAYGPKGLVDNPWTLAVVLPLITAIVLGLEWVNERHAGWRMNKREFATDVFYNILLATVIAWIATVAIDTPLLAVKTSLGITTAWAMNLPFLLQVALVIILVELGGYWMHRLMHNWMPFWLTHAVHHHITQLNATKGAVGNPLESILLSISVVMFFDIPLSAQFCAFSVMKVIGTFAHANVRADPPIWYSYFFTTIRHHSLHHSVPFEDTRHNYGDRLILLDRIFGTYREGEASVVGQGDRKRLSIWEQTIFPFAPMISAAKARRQLAQGQTQDG